MLSSPPCILITDDDPGFRQTLGGVFEPQGFRTLMAADGEEALEIVQREQVHLLLLDMHMPRLTGLDTLRRLREWNLRTPSILLSAELDDEIRDAARSAEAFEVLGKPVSRKEITDVVARALREAYDWQ
jgi:CheY-like chemotaxis protein